MTDNNMATRQQSATDVSLALIVDTTPAFIHTALPDGALDFLNQGWLKFVGLPMTDLLGWRWTSSIHPEDVEEFVDKWRASIASGQPFVAESRVRRADGVFRWFLHRKVPLRDETGLIVRWYGSSLEIEDQKWAEKELRRSDAYLSEAQRLSHTGSFGWDVISGEIYWSDETFRIFELDPKTKITTNLILERTHPDERQAVRQLMERASKERTEFAMEHRVLMPDGSIKYLQVVGRPLQDEGRRSEFVGAVTDITERKEAEKGLRASERKYRELVDTTPAFIHTASADGALDFLSRGWLEYGGVTLEDLKDWRWTAGIHPDDLEGFVEKWRTAVARGEAFEAESRIRRADGEYRWFLQRNVPLRDETGKIVKWYGTGIDIEKRKQAEFYLAEAQRLAHMGSWAFNPGGFEYWSTELLRIHGLGPNRAAPSVEEYIALVHPEDRVFVKQTIEKMLAENRGFDFTKRIVRPDGEIRRVRCVGIAMTHGGTPQAFVGTGMDVTEQEQLTEELRRSEDDLRERERELRQVLDFAPQHIGVFGPDGSPVFANHLALEYFGMTIDEWKGHSRIDFIHPDDREHYLNEAEKRLLQGEPYEFEVRFRRHDGEFRYFLIRRSPIKSDRGEITRWYATATDIEDRKRAEEEIKKENIVLREEIDKTSMFEEIVGVSAPLQSVLTHVSKVAPTDSTVLITGETGTGKELIARAIHKLSGRSARAFVSVNCSAIPSSLIASELFGHEKGAFTGATQRRQGRFELAEGGTIFLDEVGELPAEIQLALLRVLQEREFERVGSSRPIRADVRVIAATNRDLEMAIEENIFRSDLYYRLNVFPVEVPPLRERPEDIALLVEYFIHRFAKRAGKRINRISKKALNIVEGYEWPGNVRELQNVVERAVIVSDSDELYIDERWLSGRRTKARVEPEPNHLRSERLDAPLEKDAIEAALMDCKGRVSGPFGAATRLGLPASTLESRIKALRIDKRSFKLT